jgi:hypothetical protein
MNSSPMAPTPQHLGSGRELDTKPSSAAALKRASHDLISAAELLGAADGKRESAPARAVALQGLTTALRSLAAATDDLRVDTLWLLRDSEPLLQRRGEVDPVAGAAKDFSQVAGRLYASTLACASLRDHIASPRRYRGRISRRRPRRLRCRRFRFEPHRNAVRGRLAQPETFVAR